MYTVALPLFINKIVSIHGGGNMRRYGISMIKNFETRQKGYRNNYSSYNIKDLSLCIFAKSWYHDMVEHIVDCMFVFLLNFLILQNQFKV